MITRGDAVGDLQRLGVRLIPHKQSAFTTLYGRVAGWFGTRDFVNKFWLTLDPCIYYPNYISDPLAEKHLISVEHELVHIEQQRCGSLAWWVLRYLLSQDFRWRQEREAFLVNIRNGDDPLLVAALLRRTYRIDEPTETAMTAWFARHI